MDKVAHFVFFLHCSDTWNVAVRHLLPGEDEAVQGRAMVAVQQLRVLSKSIALKKKKNPTCHVVFFRSATS